MEFGQGSTFIDGLPVAKLLVPKLCLGTRMASPDKRIDQLRPHTEYNGIIYLQHSPKFHPLLWTPCQ